MAVESSNMELLSNTNGDAAKVDRMLESLEQTHID